MEDLGGGLKASFTIESAFDTSNGGPDACNGNFFGCQAWVALGGKFMFGEAISSQRWLGIAVVVIGVGMLQLSAREQRA